MNKLIATLALVGMSACATVSNVSEAPSSAPTVQLTAKERFIRAVEGQGCVLSAANVGAILSTASITADDMRTIVPELESAGQAEVASSGEIRVLSNNCI